LISTVSVSWKKSVIRRFILYLDMLVMNASSCPLHCRERSCKLLTYIEGEITKSIRIQRCWWWFQTRRGTERRRGRGRGGRGKKEIPLTTVQATTVRSHPMLL